MGTEEIKLKYHIGFTERIEDLNDVTDEELYLMKLDIEQHLQKYMRLAGVRLEDFSLEFELEW